MVQTYQEEINEMKNSENGRNLRHGGALSAVQQSPATVILPNAPRGARKITTRSRFSARGYVVAQLKVDPERAQRIGYESNLERSFVLLTLARQEVVDIVEQPFTLIYKNHQGKKRRYTFDYLVTLVDGQKCAVEVKRAEIVRQKRVIEKLAEAAAHIPNGLVDEVRLFTDEDFEPWAVINASQLHYCKRHHDSQADDTVAGVIADLKGQITIRDLVAQAGLESRGYQATIRALYSGAVHTVTRGLHGPETLVMRGTEQ